MPTSHWKAVPPGRISSSAVGTWVWVPSTAETRPSRCRPISCMSLVASAWKSRRMTFTSEGISRSTRSAAWNGESTGDMKTRPSRLKTPTRTLLFAWSTVNGSPGALSG